MCRVGSLLLLLCMPWCIYAAEGPGPVYVVSQHFDLRRADSGVSGEILILVDARFKTKAFERLWGSSWELSLSPDSALYKSLSAFPPKKARVQVRDDQGKIVAERELGAPLAKIKKWSPGGSETTFLLTVDYSQGWGSYNGTLTTILQVSKGSLHDVEALDAKTHQREPIELLKSLKAEWRITSTGNKTEIMSIVCHPKEEDHFVVVYKRYTLNKTTWMRYDREQPDFWESDHRFPPRSAFP